MHRLIPKGTTVRLRKGVFIGTIPEGREDNRTAKVLSNNLYDCGGCMLNRDLAGMQYWNESDLVIVKRAN